MAQIETVAKKLVDQTVHEELRKKCDASERKMEKKEGDYNPLSGECVSYELDSEITKLKNLSKPTVKAFLRISISSQSKVSKAGNLYLCKRAPSYISLWHLMRTRFCFCFFVPKSSWAERVDWSGVSPVDAGNVFILQARQDFLQNYSNLYSVGCLTRLIAFSYCTFGCNCIWWKKNKMTICPDVFRMYRNHSCIPRLRRLSICFYLGKQPSKE